MLQTKLPMVPLAREVKLSVAADVRLCRCKWSRYHGCTPSLSRFQDPGVTIWDGFSLFLVDSCVYCFCLTILVSLFIWFLSVSVGHPGASVWLIRLRLCLLTPALCFPPSRSEFVRLLLGEGVCWLQSLDALLFALLFKYYLFYRPSFVTDVFVTPTFIWFSFSPFHLNLILCWVSFV